MRKPTIINIRFVNSLVTRLACVLATSLLLASEQPSLAAERAASTTTENTLGMKFVAVPGTKVQFCIWPTRAQDFEAYTKAQNIDRKWADPALGPAHPVVNVSWKDAKAFCAWLTEHERKAGKIPEGSYYRLPTDEEWSVAVGIADKEQGATLSDKMWSVKLYPWGEDKRPPKNFGNYLAEWMVDDFEKTSPVGSFPPNAFGLYDMSGNVSQWCEGQLDAKATDRRLIRGCSWNRSGHPYSWSSYRAHGDLDHWSDDRGFRVVLAKEPLPGQP